ncbi:MAG: hypothetical protein ACN6QH_20395 [Pseudomonas sp.]|uniref:hypothetical protein n=1 Tax=Pseudomonas sp. TaxID=306 RepID=UPI003D10614F
MDKLFALRRRPLSTGLSKGCSKNDQVGPSSPENPIQARKVAALAAYPHPVSRSPKMPTFSVGPFVDKVFAKCWEPQIQRVTEFCSKFDHLPPVHKIPAESSFPQRLPTIAVGRAVDKVLVRPSRPSKRWVLSGLVEF